MVAFLVVVLAAAFFGSAFLTGALVVAFLAVVLAAAFFGSAFFAVFFSAILTTQVDDRLFNAHGHDIVEDCLESDLPRQNCHVGLHDHVSDIQQLDDLAYV